MHHIAIFASGTGSNARKIIEYFQESSTVQVALVVSNKADAGVLDIAAAFAIPTLVINRHDFYQTSEILTVFEEKKIDFIVLAGFLWLVPSYLIYHFPNQIINIHPALLPKYGGKGMFGMHVHEAVRLAKETETGITIHYVNEQYDEGHIIFQTTCPVTPEDSATDIAKKIQVLEHQHFPIVIESLLANK